MLSRFASRGSFAARAVLRDSTGALSLVPLRTEMTHAKRVPVEQKLVDWEAADKLFNGPERDRVNFPEHTMAEEAGKCRWGGFMPERYFEYISTKTGATGPYVLPVVALTALFSKELVVLEHNIMEIPCFVIFCLFVGKKFGAKITTSMNAKMAGFADRTWNKPMAQTQENARTAMQASELSLEQLSGKKHLYETFRENVDLQLESEYRRRMAEVHAHVQKRLDYQVAIESTKRAFEHKHMAEWIINNAVKGITPQQEKESISKCIGDLKALAATANA